MVFEDIYGVSEIRTSTMNEHIDSLVESTSLVFEGGDDFFSEKQGVKQAAKEETAAEKAEKQRQLERTTAHAKKILFGYLGKYKCFFVVGIILNILGMVGEFAAPLFIGWVIDAITNRNGQEV